MQQIMLVLAILLLIIIMPGRNSEKTAEKVSLMTKMQTMQVKETVKPEEEEDGSDNDFCIYCSVIDLSNL
jgi:hypothetical protein